MAETTVVVARKMAVKVAKRKKVVKKVVKKSEPLLPYRRITRPCKKLIEPLNPSFMQILLSKRWLILPSLHWGVERYIFLMNLHSIVQILRQIRKDSAAIKLQPPAPQLFSTPYDITESLLKQARNIAIVNNNVRNRFKCLARRWKTCHLKKANMEDLLTGEEPKQCIRLRDYKNRAEYVFEADTIHKDMYERLCHAYYIFPEPAAPRNPYTNELLTFPQFFSVMTQLYQVPGKKIHWALTGLYDCFYDLTLFQNRMASRLKHGLIQRIMSNPLNETGSEFLGDFIDDCFKDTTLLSSAEVIDYRIGLYRWAVRNMPTHPQLCRWRAVCYRQYLQRINAIPPTAHQKIEVNREINSLILQAPHHEVKTAYEKAILPAAPLALNGDDSDAWEEDFGLNHIFIVTSDTLFFNITG